MKGTLTDLQKQVLNEIKAYIYAAGYGYSNVVLDYMSRKCVRRGYRFVHSENLSELGYGYRFINNGTGHDSMIMTDFADTNMIYVPSRNGGASHCPEEWTDYEDIKKSADVLLHLVMDVSKKSL